MRRAVSIALTGTCNVLDAGSAIAFPCVERADAAKMDEHLEPCDRGLAEARVLGESKEMSGQSDGRYRLKISFLR